MPTLDAIISTIVAGCVLGGLYTLMGLGLNLIWGTTNIFNFAHGSTAAIGAYLAWSVLVAFPLFGGSYFIAFPISLGVSFLVGIALYAFSIKPVLKHESWITDAIITTLGFSIMTEYILLFVYGPRYKQSPPVLRGSPEWGPFSTRYDYLFIIAVSIITFILLWLFLHRTRTGMAVRAVEQDREAAALMGINLSKIRLLTVCLASALAGLSGLLFSSIVAIQPSYGDLLLLTSYMVVVVGGLGSVKGTIMGGFVVGIGLQLLALFLDIFWANALLYIFILLLLVFRPMGLAGVTIGV